MLAAGENSAHQDRGVDRGNLGIPQSFAGIDVRPVIKETSMVGQRSPQEAQGSERPVAGVIIGNESALLPDAQSGQPEAGCRDAADNLAVIGRTHVGAVTNQAGERIGLFPKKKKSGMFNLLEGLIVIRGKKGLRRRRCRASMLLVG